jgi:hypothetical protein
MKKNKNKIIIFYVVTDLAKIWSGSQNPTTTMKKKTYTSMFYFMAGPRLRPGQSLFFLILFNFKFITFIVLIYKYNKYYMFSCKKIFFMCVKIIL